MTSNKKKRSKEYYQAHKEERRAYYLAHREKAIAFQREWRKTHPPSTKQRMIWKERYPVLRQRLLQLLGGKCVHCGFSDPRALQVDHLNGGGTKEIRTIGAWGVYRRALKHPKEYQLLCANCNWIKRSEKKEFRNFPDLSLQESSLISGKPS